MLYLVPLMCAAAGPAQTPPAKGPAEERVALRVAPAEPANRELTPPRKRHALILCGHPGDAEHVKSFTATVRKLGDGLARTIGIPPERQYILFGADRPKDLVGATGPATREAVIAKIAEVRKAVRPEDGLWV